MLSEAPAPFLFLSIVRLPAPSRQLLRAVIHLDLGLWLSCSRQATSQLRWDQNNISTVLCSICFHVTQWTLHALWLIYRSRHSTLGDS